MSASNKPRGKYRQYSPADLVEAVDMVTGGLLSIRRASKEFNIPRGTLQDKLNGRSMLGARSGPSPVITVDEEDRLVAWCLHMCSVGYGRTRGEFLETIQKIILMDGRPNPFKNGKPGKDWYYQFLKRHPEIVERQSHDLGKERAVVSSYKVSIWFEDFQRYMSGDSDRSSILKDPSRIYNADESGFPLCAKLGKVMAPLGAKTVYQMTSGNKTQITVLACCSASAHYTPPLIVYPGSRFNYNPLQGFKEAVMGRSENGWMDSELFFVWLSTTFHNSLTERHVKRPVLLLVDGHSTHINLQTSEFCRQNGIVLYCLLEHASHIMQPLDLCLFSSLKSNWTQAVRDFQMEHLGESVTKATFASVFKQAWLKSANVRNAVQGFFEGGLFPLDPAKVVSSSKLAPGTLFSHIAQDATPSQSGDATDCVSPSPTATHTVPVSTATVPLTVAPPQPDTATVPLTVAPPQPDTATVPLTVAPPQSDTATVPLTVVPPQPDSATVPLTVVPPQPDTATVPLTVAPPQPDTATVPLTVAPPQPSTATVPLTVAPQPSTATVLISTAPPQLSTSMITTVPVSAAHIPASAVPVSAFDVHLKLPSVEIKHKKSRKRVLPKALSGDEMFQILKDKQEKKEQEAKEKEQRKIEREMKRQEREQEKARKKAEREENKRKREEEREKKACEKRKRRREKDAIFAESDSDDGEMIFDDESDECEEHEVCKVCGEGGPEENSLWIGCDLCEGWMHRACCKGVNLECMTEEEIEDSDFVCHICETILQ